MPAPRLLFANSTNTQRRSSTRPPFDLGPKKSSPTLTLSLTNVTTNGPCTISNMVPFPSSSLSIVVDSDENSHTSAGSSALSAHSLQCMPPLNKRKRSSVRLEPPVAVSNVDSNTDSKTLRKRQKLLIKGIKKGSARRMIFLSVTDLRFYASIQRNIALGVRERRRRRSPSPSCRKSFRPSPSAVNDIPLNDKKSIYEAQDVLLAGRLRTLLLNRGVHTNEVIDLEQEESPMDLDAGGEYHTGTPSSGLDISLFSRAMDVDVEVGSTGIRSSPPPPAPPSTTTTTTHPLPPSKLVANLLIRHHCSRKSSRSSTSPAGREWQSGTARSATPRQPSPLACSSNCP